MAIWLDVRSVYDELQSNNPDRFVPAMAALRFGEMLLKRRTIIAPDTPSNVVTLDPPAAQVVSFRVIAGSASIRPRVLSSGDDQATPTNAILSDDGTEIRVEEGETVAEC